jgi:hypothetical protein
MSDNTILYQLPFTTTIIMISNHPYLVLTVFSLTMSAPTWWDYIRWITTIILKREMERREFYRYCTLNVREHRRPRFTPFVITHFNANVFDLSRLVSSNRKDSSCLASRLPPLSGYLADHCQLREAVLRDSDRLLLLFFERYCTFSLLIFRKVFEPNRRVTVECDSMFVTVL